MRVAFDIGPIRENPTGVGVFATAMATALAEELPAGELAFIGLRTGVAGLPSQVPTARMSRGGYVAWLQTLAERDVRRVRADLAHFGDGMVPLFGRGKTVVSIHDMSLVRSWRTHPARRLPRIPFALLAPRLADLIMVPSRATADEVMTLTGVRAHKVEVMPYAPQHRLEPADDADVAVALAEYGLASRGYILALGTIEPRKNLVRLVEAFELLARDRQFPADMELVIAGDPKWGSAPILRRVETSAVANRIRRLGYVPLEVLGPLLTGAAAVAYPSLYEGFGLPVVEAMACGAPTVTSNISSMPEVAGDAGFLVDPYDSADIARGIKEAVHAGSTDRAAVTAAAVAQARLFSWERAARTAVHLYRERLR
jgi:alpha-1,3-rhamnosyl/mannosyltransferase